jgi:hypothetical protein
MTKSRTTDVYFGGMSIAECLEHSAALRLGATGTVHFVGMSAEESAEYASRLKAAVAAADASHLSA